MCKCDLHNSTRFPHQTTRAELVGSNKRILMQQTGCISRYSHEPLCVRNYELYHGRVRRNSWIELTTCRCTSTSDVKEITILKSHGSRHCIPIWWTCHFTSQAVTKLCLTRVSLSTTLQTWTSASSLKTSLRFTTVISRTLPCQTMFKICQTLRPSYHLLLKMSKLRNVVLLLAIIIATHWTTVLQSQPNHGHLYILLFDFHTCQFESCISVSPTTRVHMSLRACKRDQ